MMSEKMKWAGILKELWQKNYNVSSFYRRAMEAITDSGLKQKFINTATKRAQLAFELNQQILRLGGKSAYFVKTSPAHAPNTFTLNLSYENIERILKRCELIEMESITEYQKALSRINEGIAREVIIRHRKQLEIGLRELKSFESFGRLPAAPKEKLKTN